MSEKLLNQEEENISTKKEGLTDRHILGRKVDEIIKLFQNFRVNLFHFTDENLDNYLQYEGKKYFEGIEYFCFLCNIVFHIEEETAKQVEALNGRTERSFTVRHYWNAMVNFSLEDYKKMED